jgi:hypothetical protein
MRQRKVASSRTLLIQQLPYKWWRMKVDKPFGSKATVLVGHLTESYDLHDQYESTRIKKRVDQTPHGFLRKLAPDNTGHAKEFLEKFGPLQLPSGARIYGRGFHITIDLAKFWAMHLRFCLIAELWENLPDKDRLTQAIAKICEKRELASQFQAVSLGTEFSPPPEDKFRRFLFPWERLEQSGDEWLKHASVKDLRDCALYLVNIELNAHMFGRRIVWHRGFEPSGEKFRPVIWVDSLWSAIWEFFGMDMTGLAWRQCPHCQKLFYPKRKDQFYCTPRQQGLASKREYARRSRAGKLNRKSKS